MNKSFIVILFHWPHDRFALGWDWICPDLEFNYYTIKLYLLICTIEINI